MSGGPDNRAAQKVQTAARGAAGADPCTQCPFHSSAKCRERHFALGLSERLTLRKDALRGPLREGRKSIASPFENTQGRLRSHSAALRTTEGRGAVRPDIGGEGIGNEWERELGGRGLAHYVEDVAVGV